MTDLECRFLLWQDIANEAPADAGASVTFRRLAGVIGSSTELRDSCRNRVAFFTHDDPTLAKRLQADGVITNNPSQVAKLRTQMGQDSVLGACCGLSRHDAMVAGEGGADYLLFGQPDSLPPNLSELVIWASEMTVMPIGAMGPFRPADVLELDANGADLFAPRGLNWGSFLQLVRSLDERMGRHEDGRYED